MIRVRDFATVLSLILILSAVAWAQRKPDAPVQAAGSETRPDTDLFKKVYLRAGEPRILVLCGVDRRSGMPTDAKGQPQQAAGDTGDTHRHIGGDLSLFDAGGDSSLLKSNIEEVLLKNPDVDLVNLDALAEADRREMNLLSQRNERRAVQLLAQKINADLVLVINMLQVAPAKQAEIGAKYRVSVETLIPAQGRKIGGFGFDWKESTDGAMIKDYAHAISRKFIDQLDVWYAEKAGGAERGYTLRIIGLDGIGPLVKLRKAYEQIPGMARVRDRGLTGDRSTSVATLELRYAGQTLDLVYELQEAGNRILGATIDTSDAASGTITLLVKGGAGGKYRSAEEEEDEIAEALMDDQHPDHAQHKKALLDEYRNEGSPKIGILINRELTDSERLDPRYRNQLEGRGPDFGKDNVFVTVVNPDLLIAGGQNPGDGKTDPGNPKILAGDMVNTRKVEDALYKRLVRLGVVMVDPHVVRQKLFREQNKAREVFGEQELVSLIGQAEGVDILIVGTGRSTQNGHVQSFGYTFRAVRISDGVTLGAEGFSQDRFGAGLKGADFSVDDIADHSGGHLLAQMMRFWQPPRMLTVGVSNAKSQKDVFAIMSTFKSNIPGIVSADFERHEAGQQGGVGYFTMRYSSTYEELIQHINAQEAKLPFDLGVSGTTRDTLNIRIKEGL